MPQFTDSRRATPHIHAYAHTHTHRDPTRKKEEKKRNRGAPFAPRNLRTASVLRVSSPAVDRPPSRTRRSDGRGKIYRASAASRIYICMYIPRALRVHRLRYRPPRFRKPFGLSFKIIDLRPERASRCYTLSLSLSLSTGIARISMREEASNDSAELPLGEARLDGRRAGGRSSAVRYHRRRII